MFTRLRIVVRGLQKVFYALWTRLFWSPEVARRYARWLGVEVGPGAKIYNVHFGSEPWLVKIGAKTWITSGTQFVTHDGSITVVKNGPYKVTSPEALNRYGAIVIGDNCFVGVRSIIMPGVTIGDNCIVAAGSVVTKSIPEGTIVGGNPARVIGRVEDFARKVIDESLPIPSTWPDRETKRKVLRHLFFPEATENSR